MYQKRLENLLGALALLACGLLLGPWLQSVYGLTLHVLQPTPLQAIMALALLATGWLASLLPGWRAYRLSLADGLSPRI